MEMKVINASQAVVGKELLQQRNIVLFQLGLLAPDLSMQNSYPSATIENY
jgi:hypothetical protein